MYDKQQIFIINKFGEIDIKTAHNRVDGSADNWAEYTSHTTKHTGLVLGGSIMILTYANQGLKNKSNESSGKSTKEMEV